MNYNIIRNGKIIGTIIGFKETRALENARAIHGNDVTIEVADFLIKY